MVGYFVANHYAEIAMYLGLLISSLIGFSRELLKELCDHDYINI